MWFKKQRIYLDYASTTPVHTEVEKAMRPYWRNSFGNASSIHTEGKVARTALITARESVAQSLGVQSDEVLFTSSGTESNNLAIQGVLNRKYKDGVGWEDMHVVSTAIEPSSIKEVLYIYEEKGVRVTYVSVDQDGLVRPQDVAEACTDNTVLVTLSYVNNEIGVVQPIRKISQAVKAVREDIVIHADGAQAPLYHNVHMHTLGVDLLSLDAQKIYGPKGVGVLGVRRGTVVYPMLFGGAQEGGIRPGTENIPLIVGMSVALRRASRDYKTRAKRVGAVRDVGLSEIQRVLPESIVNGSLEKRTPSNINISLPGVDTEYLTLALDHEGFAVSTKSACLSGTQTSHVVYALSKDEARSSATLRITLGEETTKKDMQKFAQALARVCTRMKLV